MVRNITTDFFKTFAPEELTSPGDVVLAFKTVLRRVITVLKKRRSSHAKLTILLELSQQKLEIICLERQVGVKVANDVERKRSSPAQAGIEGMNLSGKAPTRTL